jgi:hypothetical protein
MRLLYPADTFHPKRVDEVYEEECSKAVAAGFAVSLFSFEDFLDGRFQPTPTFSAGEIILYRGWMLTGENYERLVNGMFQAGGVPFTSPDAYLLCHHLPQWYPLLRGHTPETRFYAEGEADSISADLTAAGWNGCFLKDYVKSLSTGGGSLITDLSSIPEVVGKMRKFRGSIEGGLCARRIEGFKPNSERRFFVLRGVVHDDGQPPPEPAVAAAALIGSPFFTIDIATREDGVARIIELGDGQVSDRKHWPPERFVKMLLG